MICLNLFFIRVFGIKNGDFGYWGLRLQVNINIFRGCREVYIGLVKVESKLVKWGNSLSVLFVKFY